MNRVNAKALQREILLAFWKIHILHHAGQRPVIGHWMIQELRRHGYEVSPGTLYPILHRMEHLGWLRGESDAEGGARSKRMYRLTETGAKVIEFLRLQMRELAGELFPGSQE